MSFDQEIAGVNVSRETIERLELYAGLLEKWNKSINLIAPSTISDLWARHIVDSAQVFALGRREGSWIDIGTGGGFPGLVCAIIAQEQAPDLNFSFIEADRRKCEFLRTVLRETQTKANVLPQRIEDAELPPAAVISARALAPLDRLLALSAPFRDPDTVCLFQKGANYKAELDAALVNWSFSLQKTTSQTDPNAVILSLGAIARV
ncbi:MAG: 16S rRNA (guanine(527)-N(7))-methyltransferase RsmG [Celeribacter sp.]